MTSYFTVFGPFRGIILFYYLLFISLVVVCMGLVVWIVILWINVLASTSVFSVINVLFVKICLLFALKVKVGQRTTAEGEDIVGGFVQVTDFFLTEIMRQSGRPIVLLAKYKWLLVAIVTIISRQWTLWTQARQCHPYRRFQWYYMNTIFCLQTSVHKQFIILRDGTCLENL